MPEGGTRLAGLLAGDFDLITNVLPEDVKRAPKAVSAVGLEHPVVILNAREGTQITSDPRVRQALNLAVDKNGIAKACSAALRAAHRSVPAGHAVAVRPAAGAELEPSVRYRPTRPRRALARDCGSG